MKKLPLKELYRQVALLLEKELGEGIQVSFQDFMIKVMIPREDFENRLGALLQRIQQLIDLHHPDREADIVVLVRDSGSRYENVFKIWKPAGRGPINKPEK